MKVIKKQHSVIPVYLIAVVWIIAAFFLRVHHLSGWILTAVVSAAVYAAARLLIWKDRRIETEIPDPEPVKTAQDLELDQLRQERDRAIAEMRKANAAIADPGITAQIDHIEKTTGSIFNCVLEHPEKKAQIRRFLSYYLPTTLKLLNSYGQMETSGAAGENVDSTKARIKDALKMIVEAFDRQLDALYSDEALDISTDITVMEQILQSEGLTDGVQAGGNA